MTDSKHPPRRCCLCNEVREMSREHLIPESYGGHLTAWITCSPCNGAMGTLEARLLNGFGPLAHAAASVGLKVGKELEIEIEGHPGRVRGAHSDGRVKVRMLPHEIPLGPGVPSAWIVDGENAADFIAKKRMKLGVVLVEAGDIELDVDNAAYVYRPSADWTAFMAKLGLAFMELLTNGSWADRDGAAQLRRFAAQDFPEFDVAPDATPEWPLPGPMPAEQRTGLRPDEHYVAITTCPDYDDADRVLSVALFGGAIWGRQSLHECDDLVPDASYWITGAERSFPGPLTMTDFEAALSP